ncbi:hypothetical protein PR202_gb26560 [Eleusine coracana subsp. coracana]|uniref:C2 domain-containing protein n=1 Tax=Eleusine coracana subsp. coracana TaxID=191504 RepID=A0AAV5FSH8_ELECO|nr:hypothetical protein PR202_gb26560 [Eleusine coracana subsp. coracana]
MVKKKLKKLYGKDAREFFNQVLEEQPLLPFLIPLGLFAWFVERWVVPFLQLGPPRRCCLGYYSGISLCMNFFCSYYHNLICLTCFMQYGRFKRRTTVEDLNKRWKHLILNTTPTTPIEPCEWLNKLLSEVWPNYMEPKLSGRFQSTVEDKIELQEFSLGSCPPILGDQGMRWITSGDQLLLIPILDGEAILYSFDSAPEVSIGVAFGSGGSQTIPGMELPGVSTWLVKLLTETIVKTMVEPRRLCFSLPSVDLRKRAVGGVLSVTVVSASNIGRSSNTNEVGNHRSSSGRTMSGIADSTVSQTLVEVEIGSLMRKTNTSKGPNPTWNSTFNMLTVSLVLKEWQFSDGSVTLSNSLNDGLQSPFDGSPKLQSTTGRKLRVRVLEGRALPANNKSGKCDPYVKLQYGKALYRTKTLSHTIRPVWNDKFEFDEIAGGEYLKIKCYNADTFGDESIGSARVNLEGLLDGGSRDVWVPLEKVNSGEIRLEIEPIKNDDNSSMKSSSCKIEAGWIELVVIEARDLVAADLRGTSDPYVRVQYGNKKKRTKVVYKTLTPQWNQTFEFQETGEPLILYVKDHNAMRESLKKFSGLIEEGGDPEALSLAVTEMEGIQSEQEVYIQQLEREKAALLRKIHELGSEIIRTSSGPPRTPY